jgi:hypothetical protein
MIGFDKVDRLWREMGFLVSPDDMPSLAMGTAEASILEVAQGLCLLRQRRREDRHLI